MIIGSRLKEARERHGFTQDQLAKMIGLTKGSISLYESEDRSPKLETILDLMTALGVSADYLLGSDVVIEVTNEKSPKYRSFTKEEVTFINELRKDKVIYDTLFQNPKKGVEIIKAKF